MVNADQIKSRHAVKHGDSLVREFVNFPTVAAAAVASGVAE
jgi:hypothetical protein